MAGDNLDSGEPHVTRELSLGLSLGNGMERSKTNDKAMIRRKNSPIMQME
jgi:hypothetical protein